MRAGDIDALQAVPVEAPRRATRPQRRGRSGHRRAPVAARDRRHDAVRAAARRGRRRLRGGRAPAHGHERARDDAVPDPRSDAHRSRRRRDGAAPAPVGRRSGRLLRAYRAASPDATPQQIWLALTTDGVFRIPAIRLAEAQLAHGPVWMYRFTWETPAFGGMLRSTHALEIPFVFDNLDRGADKFTGTGPERQGDRRRDAPGLDRVRPTGDPGWPAYDATRRATMRFDRADTPRLVDDPDGTAASAAGPGTLRPQPDPFRFTPLVRSPRLPMGQVMTFTKNPHPASSRSCSTTSLRPASERSCGPPASSGRSPAATSRAASARRRRPPPVRARRRARAAEPDRALAECYGEDLTAQFATRAPIQLDDTPSSSATKRPFARTDDRRSAPARTSAIVPPAAARNPASRSRCAPTTSSRSRARSAKTPRTSRPASSSCSAARRTRRARCTPRCCAASSCSRSPVSSPDSQSSPVSVSACARRIDQPSPGPQAPTTVVRPRTRPPHAVAPDANRSRPTPTRRHRTGAGRDDPRR